MLSEAMERFIKEHEKEAYDLLLTIAKIPSPSNQDVYKRQSQGIGAQLVSPS